MLTKLPYTISHGMKNLAKSFVLLNEFRLTINEPTGNFFYDPWKIKSEFKDTVWNDILETLPVFHGEARIISLEPGSCYQLHADLDDRYHLNIQGEKCFLIDVETQKLFSLDDDNHWYEMNAGQLHTAANLGRITRIQLVVRKLLQKNNLKNPINIQIINQAENKDDGRFMFDQNISPWLNSSIKKSIVDNIKANPDVVEFDIEKDQIAELQRLISPELKISLK